MNKSEILKGIEGITASKFIDNNTVEYFINEDRFIRLHSTDILVFSGDSIRVSSGGWKTVTTKDHINKFLPAGYCLISENGFWFISHVGSCFPFKDGMVIDTKTDTADSGNYQKALKSYNFSKKKETVFVNKYVDLLIAGKMEKPSSGDCFICQIAAQNSTYKNYDHIQSHIDESYLVPSLIYAACLAAGNTYYRNHIYAIQTGGTAHISRRDILHILRKYFKQQKGG